MTNEVTNALDQTEIEKLKSILMMLQGMVSGAAPEIEVETPPDLSEVEMAEQEEPTDDTEMQEIEVEKAVIDETGDSKAEDRLSNVTELTDQSLSEIGKALSTLLPKRTVQKSSPTNQLTTAVNELTKVVKGMAIKFNDQEKFNDTLMKGLGFTEEVVKKSVTEETGPKERPVQSGDANLILKSIVEQLASNNANPDTKNPWNDKRGVNKNINTLLNSLNSGRK